MTWGNDAKRTGWNQTETVLGKNNVSQLELKWKTQLSTPSSEVVLSTTTAPLVAVMNQRQGLRTLVFVVGSDDTVYAIEAESEK